MPAEQASTAVVVGLVTARRQRAGVDGEPGLGDHGEHERDRHRDGRVEHPGQGGHQDRPHDERRLVDGPLERHRVSAQDRRSLMAARPCGPPRPRHRPDLGVGEPDHHCRGRAVRAGHRPRGRTAGPGLQRRWRPGRPAVGRPGRPRHRRAGRRSPPPMLRAPTARPAWAYDPVIEAVCNSIPSGSIAVGRRPVVSKRRKRRSTVRSSSRKFMGGPVWARHPTTDEHDP